MNKIILRVIEIIIGVAVIYFGFKNIIPFSNGNLSTSDMVRDAVLAVLIALGAFSLYDGVLKLLKK